MKNFRTLIESVQLLLEMKVPILETADELLEWMTKNLSYGLYSKREKKLISDFESDDFSKNYRYMDSKEVLKVGGGVCWDKTRFAMQELKKMDIEAEEYFCKLDLGPDFPSHSFILISEPTGKYRLFECSWSDYYGLHKPMSKVEIFKMVHRWFRKKYPKSKDFICWRMKVQPKVHSTCDEYMKVASSGVIEYKFLKDDTK